MATLSNTVEGGSNGTTITVANSGGGSGNAFEGVTGTGTKGTDYFRRYSTDITMVGSRCDGSAIPHRSTRRPVTCSLLRRGTGASDSPTSPRSGDIEYLASRPWSDLRTGAGRTGPPHDGADFQGK